MAVKKTIRARGFVPFWGIIVSVVVIIGGVAIGYQTLSHSYQLGQLAAQHYQAGLAFEKIGDWPKSAEEYESALRIQADYKDTQVRLAQARANQAATATAVALAPIASATAAAEAILATGTAAAQAQGATATADAELRETTATGLTQLAMLTATTEAQAQVEALYQKGLDYAKMERWAEAKAALQQVFEADPNHKDVQTALADAQSKLDAKLASDKLAAMGTATAEALAVVREHYQRGLAYANLKKWQQALAEFEAVIAVDPRHEDVQDRFLTAQKEWDSALTLTPSPTETPTEIAIPTATSTLSGTPTPTPTSPRLAAPVLVSPADHSVFDFYPRTTRLVWKPVNGARSYGVEIQAYYEKWFSRQAEGFIETDSTEYTFNFGGMNPGRWRVWAIGPNGEEGERSLWWEFEYIR